MDPFQFREVTKWPGSPVRGKDLEQSEQEPIEKPSASSGTVSLIGIWYYCNESWINNYLGDLCFKLTCNVL